MIDPHHAPQLAAVGAARRLEAGHVKRPAGRWKRNTRMGRLELVIGGSFTASIKAGPVAYVWTIYGTQATGTATSEYAAQRAVRRALRAALDDAAEEG